MDELLSIIGTPIGLEEQLEPMPQEIPSGPAQPVAWDPDNHVYVEVSGGGGGGSIAPWSIDGSGNLVPGSSLADDIGTTALRVRQLYTGTIDSSGSVVSGGLINNGNMFWNPDNTWDLGWDGAGINYNRPRDIYAGTGVKIAGGPASATGPAIWIGASGMTAPRLRAPMDVSPNSDRFQFRTSTPNGSSYLGVAPDGTGTESAYISYQISDTPNSPYVIMWAMPTQGIIGTGASGVGVGKDLAIWANGERWLVLAASGHLLPNVDGAQNIGSASAQLGTIHCFTVSTNTLQARVGATNLNIDVGGAQNISFTTAVGLAWRVASSGHLIAGTTNSYDIGTSAGSKPRNVFVAGAVANRTKAGTPVDADVNTPTDGMLIVDTTASKIWVRIGGTWKQTAALT